jgi:tetratricopeptide (TPR) repeat protein
MVFCIKCGQELSESDAFCLKCGEPQAKGVQGPSIAADMAEHHDQRGDAFLEAEQYSQALSEYDQAVKLNPNSSPYYAKRASALAGLGRFNEAFIALNQAIGMDPKDPEFHSQKGNLMLITGKADEAIAELDKAIEFDPSTAIYHAVKCHALYSAGKCEESLKEIDLAIQIGPDELGLLLDKAAALATCGKSEVAVDTMNDLMAEIGSTGMRESIEYALRASYMRDQARELFERFLEDAKRIEAEVAKELPIWTRVDFCNLLSDLVFFPQSDSDSQTIGQARLKMLSALPRELTKQMSPDSISQLLEKASVSGSDLTEQEQQLMWVIRNSWYDKYSRLENTTFNLDRFSKAPSERKDSGSLYSQVRQLLIDAIARDTPYSEFKMRLSRIEQEKNVTEEELEVVPAAQREAHLIELHYPLEGDTEAQTSAKGELFHAALGIEMAILPVGVNSGYGVSEIHRLAMEKAPKYKWLVSILDHISGDAEKDWNVRATIFIGLVFDSSKEELEGEIKKAQQEDQAKETPKT